MASCVKTPEVVLGKGWLVARYGKVQCAHFDAEVDERSFDAYVELLAHDIDQRRTGQRIGMLCHVPTATVVDSSLRRRVAKLLNDRQDKLHRTTAAYAMATQSPFVRGVLTTLFWMAPPKYPHKVVATPKQGLGFLAEHMPDVDANAIADAFEGLLDEQLRRAS